MHKRVTGLLIAALCMLCLVSIVGMSENREESSVPITIDDALLTARKYMAENRILAGKFQITSAVLRDQPEEEKSYWEIIFKMKPEGSQVTHMTLRVYMNRSVERAVSKKPEQK
jgi:hypothetical protein